MRPDVPSLSDRRDRILGWSALGGSAIAVFAWAACCVLPIALSFAGVSLAGMTLVAGQRTWLTLAAVVVLGVGWWSVWRRRRACEADAGCRPPARLTLVLLTAATCLAGLALVWQPLVEPRVLMLLRSLRG
jgi:mercuric ion transport protein